jgi:glycosyltransferase involved in cell wall biosynthesis
VGKLMQIDKTKILCINPGASRTGAPILFLSFIKWLKRNSDFEIAILYCSNGELETEFRQYGNAFFWNGWFEYHSFKRFYLFRLVYRILRKIYRQKDLLYQDWLIKRISENDYDLIYANTVTSCSVINRLAEKIKKPVILHVRELEMGIQQFGEIEEFRNSIPYINHFISDSEAVKENLIQNHDISTDCITTVYEYINCEELSDIASQKEILRKKLRNELNIPENAFVIGSSGTTDWRKAPDIMIQVAYDLIVRKKDINYFVWVGGDDKGLEYRRLIYDCKKMGIEPYVRFTGHKVNPVDYFACFDLFLLCSREEPVGIVAMEAASMGIPCIYFENAGGIKEFAGVDGDISVPYLNTTAASDKIYELKLDPERIRIMGAKLKNKLADYDISFAGKKIMELFNRVLLRNK